MAESTDIAVREERALTLIDSGEFADRVAPLLPDTVPVRRFLQVAKTAIRTNPDLAKADQRTLMGCLIRCAQDGLLPDGREAALAVYGDKVSYLPMIGGLRKVLAEYGWTLKTRVVHFHDDFEYSEEPPMLRHTPVRPGSDPGDRIAAYAVATHRDGRRLQIVLDAAAIEKRKSKAKTKNVWTEWPEAMWEKSAGHAIFDEIPKAERDRMIVPADNGVDDAVELLYGPDGTTFQALEAPADQSSDRDEPSTRAAAGEAHGGEAEPQQAAAPQPPSGAAAAPGADDEPEPQPAWVAAGATVIDGGNWAGKTIAEVAEVETGVEWIGWALARPGKFDPNFHEALATYVEGALPELWAAHSERSAA